MSNCVPSARDTHLTISGACVKCVGQPSQPQLSTIILLDFVIGSDWIEAWRLLSLAKLADSSPTLFSYLVPTLRFSGRADQLPAPLQVLLVALHLSPSLRRY